jgi:hypothetical protein
MRALADDLRMQARRTGRLGHVRTPTWRGVGAQAFAGRLRGAVARADATAAMLLDTARLLDLSAEETAWEQQTWRRRMDDYEAALRERGANARH